MYLQGLSSDLKISDLLMFCHERYSLVACIMMWKMSGMKLYLALSRWECVCAYGRIISLTISVLSPNLYIPHFKHSLLKNLHSFLNISGELGFI